MDVFAAAGDPDGIGAGHEELASGPPIDASALGPVLLDATLWGLELDTRYRVLAVTVEPTGERYVWPDRDDRRLQVLAFPVSTILVVLRSADRTLHTFAAEQLVEVSAAVGGSPLRGPILGGSEPRPGEWGPTYSLEGRSSAPDGTSETMRFEVASDDLELLAFARFDELRLRDAAGGELGLPT